MRHRDKLVPMVVALPLFLQHIDSTAIGTALPTISVSLGIDTLRLNLAITAYLISVAIFLPASGWIAERYGARRVFCAAIAVFTVASALCALSNSLEMLVACRVLQGLGGAMMIPVGRLLLLRNVAPIAMVAAMAWFTVPPAMGRLMGPAIGGAIVTWLSWRWVFLINVPLGLLGIALALWVLDDSVETTPPGPFDLAGFGLMGLGLASVLCAVELSGSKLMPSAIAAGLGGLGVACLVAYGFHSRRKASPLIDLRIIRYPAFFASTVGGTPLRLAVGALPFLLPLMFQLGFGMSPLDSGLLTLGTALGTLGTRTILQGTIDRYGFRPVLLGATVCSSVSYAVFANLGAATPHVLILVAAVCSGLVMSLVLMALQTIAFTEVPPSLTAQSTALNTMAQQLSFSLGVVLATELLRTAVWWRGGQASQLAAADFSFAFYGLAVTVLFALPILRRLPHDVGADMRKG